VTVEATVRITNPTGLHARPAVKLAQLAASFDADVRVRVGSEGEWVRARSTARVMKLKAGANATLQFQADGNQASSALRALVDLVQRDFDEQPQAAPPAEPMPAAPAQEIVPGAVRGEIAARGIAMGPLHVLRATVTRRQPTGSPARERHCLEDAMARATAALRDLAHTRERVAREVIEFQVSLLQDNDFTAPVLAAIATGVAADQAWTAHLQRELADYEAAHSSYFKARAADLRDLQLRVARALVGAEREPEIFPDGAILVAEELTPSAFLELDWHRLGGAATRNGSSASHVAMLARSLRVPYLVSLERDPERLEGGVTAVLDGDSGFLLPAPDADQRRHYERLLQEQRARAKRERGYLTRSARLADGSPVKVYVNVDHPSLLDSLKPAHCDGIGLTRTEFLFQGAGALPDEDHQYQAYRKLLEWAAGRPVTVRTLDAGGDKPVPGLTLEHERNPFLGVRGVRLSLARPEVFRVQLRALARAAAHGELKVMVPMVTLPNELAWVGEMLSQELRSLREAGYAARRPKLGMMVEVPAAALAIVNFKADFYSVGSNDLTQYVMAAGRDSAETAALLDPLHPAILELVRRVARHGAAVGAEVSVCGEMAAAEDCLPALLEAGVRVLSVPPAALGTTKAALAAL